MKKPPRTKKVQRDPVYLDPNLGPFTMSFPEFPARTCKLWGWNCINNCGYFLENPEGAVVACWDLHPQLYGMID